MKNFYHKGITAIEALIIIAIIVIIVSIALPQFSKSRERQVLKSAVSDIISSLNKTQSQTLASANSSSYGVHFEADKVIIFKGQFFVVGDGNNETINIVSPAQISNVTLGGVSGISGELYFNRLSGTPSKTGTVVVATHSFSKTITIYAAGSVSAN